MVHPHRVWLKGAAVWPQTGCAACLWLAACASSEPPPSDVPSLSASSAAAEPALAGGRGELIRGVHPAPGGDYPWLFYLPFGHDAGRATPLYVMLHGCSTRAEQQMQVNGLNPIADREGFAVLYPDVTPLHARQCWRAVFGSPADRTAGGGGDVDALMAMIQAVQAQVAVDARRIYLMGMSSGGFAATALAAAHPDTFAAVGVVAAGADSMDLSCAALTEDAIPLLVERSLAAMAGTGSPRLHPFLAIGGDVDALRLGSNASPGGCARLAFLHWQQLAARLGTPPDASAAEQASGAVDGGRAWQRRREFRSDGCRIGEYWDIAGMGHYWPGGSADPALAAFTDPLAPDGAEISWKFFAPLTLDANGKTRC